jgi:predicted Fe-Mo cluster-binding NifX family protein
MIIMKIAVSAKGGSLQAQLDERFGRCQYFVIVDSETMKMTAFSNPSVNAAGGAGPASAQKIAEYGAKVLITGNVGMNAQRALESLGIQVVTGAKGTVKEAIESYLSG